MKLLFKYILFIQQQFESDKKELKNESYTEDLPTDYNPRWADDF
jgi:hypothetical protein